MKKAILICLVIIGFATKGHTQKEQYGDNQPYSSYWFVDELLQWSAESEKDAKFNISQVALASRFLNDSTKLNDDAQKIPGIIALMAPYTTNFHPSQGFSTVKQYVFPFWQYIDYFVQWGGSANEGIIVSPTAFWTDVAHKNGVKSIGTVFFPPNVYGGKEEWVYEFLVQREDGSFPVADKLIEVATTYNFDGWFINQETYDLVGEMGELMQQFISYYRERSNLKLVWYDAMIDDSRVIWQDELNNHNQIFFQKEDRSMSDVFFINFRYNEVNLEDSKVLARELGRSEWDLFAGIDVQSKSFKTPIKWDALYKDGKPNNTSIGIYWSNSTFDMSETKLPDDVYANEQQFWNGGQSIETRFGKKTWLGFADYFEPRSVINELPFKTNFNYGLGYFYNEQGKTVSSNEWHNLSIQDILPTWQFQVDTIKVKASINFNDSYTGGSSLLFEGNEDADIPLYKTKINLDKNVKFKVVTKTIGPISLEIYCQLSNGDILTYPIKKSLAWKNNSFTIPANRNLILSKIGVRTKGKGSGYVGELSLISKKETKPSTSTFKVQAFSHENGTELYVHFTSILENVYHNLYYVNAKNEKVWLGKTPAQDFYISDIPTKKGIINLEVQSESFGGAKGKIIGKMVNLMN
ncbi:endo-beta-N-acetylglucosaminidase [Maribacter sp. Asnod1-A12]|uniref:endo-beta-N-acetylglucosaminidase n=1 Tax=Maribacter sp. Asnod1-A12 TaxID=3160576 RepID=UPI0038643B76